jgi:hypothetical protein
MERKASAGLVLLIFLAFFLFQASTPEEIPVQNHGCELAVLHRPKEEERESIEKVECNFMCEASSSGLNTEVSQILRPLV